MYASEESNTGAVPMKQPNKEGQPSAEAAEGRRRPKENDARSSTSPTQSGKQVSQGLSGVRRVARARKQEQFTALLHHVTVKLLRESFDALKKNAAPGVDGVTWREYEMGLEDRLVDLHSRVHRGTYRAQPSRRDTFLARIICPTGYIVVSSRDSKSAVSGIDPHLPSPR